MGLKVLVDSPTDLLTTLDRVKRELAIKDRNSDDILLDLLTDASTAITRECGRLTFGVMTCQEWMKGTGSQLLGVSHTPLLAVSEILEDTIPLVQTDPYNGYWINDSEAGAIYRPSGWGQTVALMSWGWEAYSSRYILPGGTLLERYQVTYTSGYVMPGQEYYLPYDRTVGVNPTGMLDPQPLPGDIVRACLETIKAWWFNLARNPYIGSAQVDNVKIQYSQAQVGVGSLPLAALGFLRDYRRVVAP